MKKTQAFALCSSGQSAENTVCIVLATSIAEAASKLSCSPSDLNVVESPPFDNSQIGVDLRQASQATPWSSIPSKPVPDPQTAMIEELYQQLCLWKIRAFLGNCIPPH